MRAFLVVIATLFASLFIVSLAQEQNKDSSVALTKENFDEITSGKTVFIKFYAPWCGHCQELAPAWEKLAAEWISHETGLVASVDCSTEEEFCRKHFAIQGLPTLLYGDASQSGAYLHEYRDEKSYEALSKFAKNTIAQPMCSPANLDPCEPQMKKQIQSVLKLTEKKLAKEIAKKEQAIENAHEKFDKEFQKMQRKYDTLAADHQAKEARIKANIKMIKAVQQTKEK